MRILELWKNVGKENFALKSRYRSQIVITWYYLHYYFTRLNLIKMGPLQFCLPVLIWIHKNPKQKIFLKFLLGIVERIPWEIVERMFKWMRLNHFFFQISCRVKKCHFGSFAEWAGMAVQWLVLAIKKPSSHHLELLE